MKLLNVIFSLLAISFLANNCYSQQYYDIKLPVSGYSKKCRSCLELIKSKPKEIQFGIRRDDLDNLYFVCNNKEWLEALLKKGGDGIAIDIVSKERYDCSIDKASQRQIVRGELQRPVYLKELKKNMLPSFYGEAVVKMGQVPQKFKGEDIEFNLLFLKSKHLCYYHSSADLKAYRWELLDMGFYFDTLTYKTNFDSSLSEQERYILQNKILKFEIPFEKNKAEYSSTDMRPLYDSLDLTDFNIKKITIRAYSSIEGNEERNRQLQKERAQSIISALQAYQKSSILTEVSISENWVEFLNDISTTPLAYLADLSKEEIKEKLKNKSIQAELEKILPRHRKAIIVLELQKKNRYESFPVNELVDLFSASIAERNLKQAVDIQNSIFEKVRYHEIPVTYLDSLELPRQADFSLLLSKHSIFKYLMSEQDVHNTLKELTELQYLTPNDGHLKYNICALKFKVWLLGASGIDPLAFRNEIGDLKKWGIHDNLIKRMLINYEIIMCEYYMAQGKFPEKDKSLRFISSNYKYVPLSDSDYLSLAQYFASYTKYDWSIKLLEKKVKAVDADEDLLFYYLNLTLIDDRYTRSAFYRTIMLNSYNINPSRFCQLFAPFGEGGMTFQLLENEYLRQTYCENCNN